MDDRQYEGWIVVFKSGTDYEADLVRDRLDDAGIPAVVLSQRDHAFNVSFGDMAQVRVLTPPEHVEAASQLLPKPALWLDHRFDLVINACVIGGVVLQILGGLLLSMRALVLGTVMLIIGLGLVARKKDHPWAWGLMGLLSGIGIGVPIIADAILFAILLGIPASVIGLLVVAALRDRSPMGNPDEELEQAAMTAAPSPLARDTERAAMLDSGNEQITLSVPGPEDEDEGL